MSMQGLGEAYLALTNGAAPPDNWQNSIDVTQARAFERYELLHKAFVAACQRVIDGKVLGDFDLNELAALRASTEATPPPNPIAVAREGWDRKQHEIGTLPLNGPPEEAEGESYEDWVRLAEECDRKPTDFIRTWMRDIPGGWDRSSPEDRVQMYQKARDHYADKNGGGREDGEIDFTLCYRCGSEGDEKNGRNGVFYVCTNKKCGFMGDDGWVSTKWDAENWSEKREQFERMKERGRGRGSSGGRSSGSRGRSYGGRR